MEPFKQPNMNLSGNTGVHLENDNMIFKTNGNTTGTMSSTKIDFKNGYEIGLPCQSDTTDWGSIGRDVSSGGRIEFQHKGGIGDFIHMKNSRLHVHYDDITQTTYRLYVSGSGYATVSFNSSDDRIKYNEVNITNTDGLSIIKQLQPQKYEKIMETPQGASGTWIPTDAEWPNVKDNYVWRLEAGLIAQDIQAIPGLSFAVSGQEVNSEGTQTPLGLNYNDIYAYHIAATKELSFQLDTEKAKTTNLETQMESANSKIAVLETQMADLIARVSALENA